MIHWDCIRVMTATCPEYEVEGEARISALRQFKDPDPHTIMLVIYRLGRKWLTSPDYVDWTGFPEPV